MDGNEIWLDVSVRVSREHYEYLTQETKRLSDIAQSRGLSTTFEPKHLISVIVQHAIDERLHDN